MTDGDQVDEPRSKRALITFGYAGPTDEDWLPLAVTSREMLQVERQVKGFTANGFFKDVSISGLYRIAYVVLRMRGTIERVDFETFVEQFDVKFGDPTAPVPAPGDESDDDDERSEVDPTIPAV